jgi:hypothetical protein
MPIFNQDITFIHIPKCGGTSIENFVIEKGLNVSLYRKDLSVLINDHTPQHCTFSEIEKLGLLTEKIFTVVRSDLDRVISEFFYIKKYRKSFKGEFKTFDEFLDLFLSDKNSRLFDSHNKKCIDFLLNEEGIIDKRIKIFNFFDVEGIENFLGINGLEEYHHLKTDKKDFSLSDKQIQRIKDFYGDSIWL